MWHRAPCLCSGWPAAVKHQTSNICGWPAAGLRQSNMLEKLHKTQSPRRFQHTLYCTRTHTHTAPHTHPASPKQAAAYTHRIQIQYGRQGNTDRQGIGKVEGILVFIGTSSVTAAKRMSFFHNSFQVRGPYRRHTDNTDNTDNTDMLRSKLPRFTHNFEHVSLSHMSREF